MKAVRAHHRGGPEQLVYEEVPKPLPRSGDALVRVCACAFTPTELSWPETYTAEDGTARLPTVPGHEVSGVVEALGEAVDEPPPGAEVYGLTDFRRDGGAAEYVLVGAGDLALKPRNVSHTEAASAPLSALTAWQALFDHARVNAGQRVLIHAAAGGVGTFAVQLAHWRGAEVVATARAVNREFLLALGADEVIDYTAVRFDEKAGKVDMVLDALGGDVRERSWSLLRPGGILVAIAGGAPDQEEAARHHARGVYFIVRPDRGQLCHIAKLMEARELRSIVQEVFPLEETRRAFEQGLRGHNRGKLVLQVC